MDEPVKTPRHLDVETLGPAAAALIEQALNDREPLAIHRGGEAVAEVRVVAPAPLSPTTPETNPKRITLSQLAAFVKEFGMSDEERRAYAADVEAIRREVGLARDPWDEKAGA